MYTTAARNPAPSLHVVHVVLTLNVGGLERNVVNQVREGRKLGQRVSILCLEEPGTLAARAQEFGAEVIALHKRPGLRPEMLARLVKVFRRLRPDVIHTHQIATLLYGGAAARWLNVPVVVHTEHGQERYATRFQTRMLGRVSSSLCDYFYCLTDAMAEGISSRHIVKRSKIRVIHNGIDIQSFAEQTIDKAVERNALGIPCDAIVVGTVGRLTEIKRQDVLIRAFAKMRQQCPAVHLVLVGAGPLLEELKGLAESLGISQYVHFAGYQPHSGRFLRLMDMFVLSSRSEGMPQAVLEASVCELPVIASRVGGLPELIKHDETGLLFPVGDEDRLSSLLRELAADPSRRQRLGRAARARVESRYSVARMAGDYHRDFVELLATRRARKPKNLRQQAVPAAAMEGA